jgi:hypothetical protein
MDQYRKWFMTTMKILTNYLFPPIPYHHMDWIAYIDGQEEGTRGFGRTEEEAIKYLKENLEEQ